MWRNDNAGPMQSPVFQYNRLRCTICGRFNTSVHLTAAGAVMHHAAQLRSRHGSKTCLSACLFLYERCNCICTHVPARAGSTTSYRCGLKSLTKEVIMEIRSLQTNRFVFYKFRKGLWKAVRCKANHALPNLWSPVRTVYIASLTTRLLLYLCVSYDVL